MTVDPGLFFPGNYSSFLEKKEEFLHAQAKHQESLENRVRNEIEWLRRGPKARATKAKARINTANQLISELADLNSRTRTASGSNSTTWCRQTRPRRWPVDAGNGC